MDLFLLKPNVIIITTMNCKHTLQNYLQDITMHRADWSMIWMILVMTPLMSHYVLILLLLCSVVYDWCCCWTLIVRVRTEVVEPCGVLWRINESVTTLGQLKISITFLLSAGHFTLMLCYVLSLKLNSHFFPSLSYITTTLLILSEFTWTEVLKLSMKVKFDVLMSLLQTEALMECERSYWIIL